MTYIEKLFAALYVSEVWHNNYRKTGSIYAKTRAMVIYDRIMTDRQVFK